MSAPAVTFCDECDGVTLETRKRSPSQWSCIFFPRLDGGSFIAQRAWAEHEPHMRCININGGRCPCWTPRREAEEAK